MFMQVNYNTNSGYYSDNSNYSFESFSSITSRTSNLSNFSYSSNFSCSSNSSGSSNTSNTSNSSSSSNSSNFTITSDPINYMKENLKQHPQKFKKQLEQLQQQQQHQHQQSQSHQSQNESYSLRKKQSQIFLERHRLLQKYKDEENNKCIVNNGIICRTIGFDSGLNRNTPFINYLINKRINFCVLGASSHIAAFVPVTNNSRWCFIRGWKGKCRYG